MKMLNNHLCKTVIGISFLGMLLTMTACKERKESTGNTAGSHIDSRSTVMTGNIETLQQHILTGSRLNEEDPFGGLLKRFCVIRIHM
jgi:hypothetical protein